MGTKAARSRFADVICQHNSDGTIVPIKIRLTDDDGEYQTYTIHSYKDMSHSGMTGTSPDGVVVTSHTRTFDCKIGVFGTERVIRLFYNTFENTWRVFS